jgi:isopenicillin N synthase-like dioxygenase
MPSRTDSSFYLPLVDITPWLHDPRSAAAQQVVNDVRAACRSTGFFQIKGHGVSPTLQKSIFEASARFFALPTDVKLQMDCRKFAFRGYDVMGSQSYDDDEPEELRDMKEGFFASTDLPPDHPRVINGRFLQGPNVWPPTELLPSEDFRTHVEEYYKDMLRLSRVVLDLIAATLPYGPQVFDELQANDPMWLFRLLHYPPTPSNEVEKRQQFGSGEHTDFGAITLLIQDEHPGLEVQDHETGEWVGVPPNKDVYVVNLGDVMSKITGQDYRSSVHRVVNKNTEDRYSVVFFLDGNLDYKLRRLDGGDEDAITVEDHVRQRMSSSYTVQKK